MDHTLPPPYYTRRQWYAPNLWKTLQRGLRYLFFLVLWSVVFFRLFMWLCFAVALFLSKQKQPPSRVDELAPPPLPSPTERRAQGLSRCGPPR